MAPAFPIDYTGQRESKTFSKAWGSLDVMGKTRKVSEGHSNGFVPDYRHVVGTESECFRSSSGRVDAELTASQPYKRNNNNNNRFDPSAVPIQILSLAKISPMERRDLEMRFRSELERVKNSQKMIASSSFDAMVSPPTTDVHCFSSRPAMVESLAMSTSDVPMGKKKYPGRNGPRTKSVAVASGSNESAKEGPPQSTSFVMLMKQCETLLTRLMNQKFAWVFNVPVDIVRHKAPNYYNVIKHPMDLGTVKTKLLSNQYSSPMEFAEGVRLVFKNAMTYNPPKHDVYVMAEILSKFFEVRWKTIEKKISQTADDSAALRSTAVVEPENSYVPPLKKQKAVSMENKVKDEGDKEPMSEVEKQNLAAELAELVEELPENIINFINENTSNDSQVGEDEIELDIDALSNDTLFTLRKLLDDYQLEKQKKQATLEPCEIEMQKESAFSNLSVQPGENNQSADEDVDIDGDGNDPPPVSSSPLVKIDNSVCSNSRCSSGASGSSSTDSESPASDADDGAKNSVPSSTVNETAGARLELKESDLDDQNIGEYRNGNAEQNPVSNSSSIEPRSRQEGESAPSQRQVSPDKLYRAALLRSRFADIIIKAQENTSEKGEKPDPEKLKLEREELERRRREEKVRLQAEAKAAEEARKKAEAEAAAEARRKRELEREAARQALLQMEKTVEINESSQFMEDLEMFRSAPDEHLQSFIEEASPDEKSLDALCSFKFEASSNPLEQLGLYMKKEDEEEEEEVEPQTIMGGTSNDPEEGEID